jgi:hypothetical protein
MSEEFTAIIGLFVLLVIIAVCVTVVQVTSINAGSETICAALEGSE